MIVPSKDFYSRIEQLPTSVKLQLLLIMNLIPNIFQPHVKFPFKCISPEQCFRKGILEDFSFSCLGLSMLRIKVVFPTDPLVLQGTRPKSPSTLKQLLSKFICGLSVSPI